MEGEETLKIFETLFPELDLSGSRLDNHGWDSKILFLQGGRVAKIPPVNGNRKLEREYCVLKAVKPLLGKLLPERISFSRKKLRGEPFGVIFYDAVKGITIDDAVPLSRDMETSIWTQMTRILPGIHHYMPSDLGRCGIPSMDGHEWRNYYVEFLQELRGTVFPVLDDRLSGYLESQIRAFIDNDSNFSFRPGLIHGDIDPRNLIWDTHSLRISGIIDWGDSMIGDPAFDYASMLFNERIGLQIIRNQRELFGTGPIRRMEFYHRMVPVYWIVYGLRNGNEKLVGDGIMELENRMEFRIPSR